MYNLRVVQSADSQPAGGRVFPDDFIQASTLRLTGQLRQTLSNTSRGKTKVKVIISDFNFSCQETAQTIDCERH